MPRKPIEVEMRSLQTPRERIWAAILAWPKGKPFTKLELQDTVFPMVSWTMLQDYARVLEMAGYLQRVGGQPSGPKTYGKPLKLLLVHRAIVAPRLDKHGQEVTQGLATTAMWRAMKVLRDFDYLDIVRNASIAPMVIKPETAKGYVLALARAGYLALTRPSKPGVPGRYKLARNTGPHAPAITRRKCVFDRNTGTFAELQTAQEVCDGIDE
ncbi:hypothetical protein ACO2Q9_02745 [Variovorax sp. VNK109]|uniref:hypothetical protein n=1 Tax=Variovorax sp. VNK109 TaxID=3400919 RepID=UPI003C03C0BD